MLSARLNKLEKVVAEAGCPVALTMQRVYVLNEGEPRPVLPPCGCGQSHHVKVIIVEDDQGGGAC